MNKPYWLAKLDLTFDYAQERTRLIRRQHQGPLVIQKALYPEGQSVCHGIVLHPPGGVAGGDDLRLGVELQPQAKVLLTTPGAGKWYRTSDNHAAQQVNISLAEQSCLEWLPQENILFDGAHVKLGSSVKLAAESVYASWEVTCLGRQARAETWAEGHLSQHNEIWREQQLIWYERISLSAQSRLLRATMGLAGQVVSGNFVVAAGSVPAELLTQCRALSAAGRYGITALPELFLVRYLGDSALAARAYFEAIWQIMRPWYLEKQAVRPRIW